MLDTVRQYRTWWDNVSLKPKENDDDFFLLVLIDKSLYPYRHKEDGEIIQRNIHEYLLLSVF